MVSRCARDPRDHLESESLVSEEEESDEDEDESELELLALRRAGMECGSALTLAFSAVEDKQSRFTDHLFAIYAHYIVTVVHERQRFPSLLKDDRTSCHKLPTSQPTVCRMSPPSYFSAN